MPKGPLYEYDVAITPPQGTNNRRLRRRIFHLAEASRQWADNGLRGFVAHDHSSKLIAAKQLVQPLDITVPYYDEDEQGPRTDGRGKEYTLTITFIQPIDTSGLSKYVRPPCMLSRHILTDVQLSRWVNAIPEL